MLWDNYFSYFFWFGTIGLIILTYMDYTGKKGLVDDRKNWVMLGIAISLVTHMRRNVLYLLGISFLATMLYVFLKKIKALGQADNNSITWIFYGLGIISPYYLLYYLLVFSSITGMYLLFKNVIFKYKGRIQFYPVLLISFVTFAFLFKLY